MTPVEDIVRSTTRAIAETVREVPSLKLSPGADELVPAAPASAEPVALAPRARRRSRAWLAPVAAAAAVLAIAVSLVIVRDIPNGRGVPPADQPSASSVPRYYVAASQLGKHPAVYSLVIGDTRTGARLAAVAPPRGSTFQGVTGAADDRTFVVSSMPSSPVPRESLPVTWYLLRIAPGAAGYTLTKLAIPDVRSWAVEGIALSGSGRELAMTLFPVSAKHQAGSPWWELRVYSVATGKLLRTWSSTEQNGFAPVVTVPGLQDNRALTWVDSDHSIAFPTFGAPGQESERLLDVTARGGNLITHSRVIWSMPVRGSQRCLLGSPRVTADGKSVVCNMVPVRGGKQDHSRLAFGWLAYSLSAPGVPHVLYKVTVHASSQDASMSNVLWSAPSGRTLIIDWAFGRSLTSAAGFEVVRSGIVSDGRFRPLPSVPAILPEQPVVAW
jgi:hypothetical protein